MSIKTTKCIKLRDSDAQDKRVIDRNLVVYDKK